MVTVKAALQMTLPDPNFSLDRIAYESTIGLGKIPFNGSLGCRFFFLEAPRHAGVIFYSSSRLSKRSILPYFGATPSHLESTCTPMSATVDSKGLTKTLSLLDAMLTKKKGRGYEDKPRLGLIGSGIRCGCEASPREWACTTHYRLLTTHFSQCTLKSKLAIDLLITFS